MMDKGSEILEHHGQCSQMLKIEEFCPITASRKADQHEIPADGKNDSPVKAFINLYNKTT